MNSPFYGFLKSLKQGPLSVAETVYRDRDRDRDRVRDHDRGYRACEADPSSHPTPPPTKSNPAHMYYRNLLGEGGGTRALVADAAPETE